MDILTFLIYTLIIMVAVFIFSFVFYRWIYTPYKKATQSYSLDDLITTLNLIIELQLKLYDDDIFIIKQSLTNSNYENYYRDISQRIYSSLSKNFYKNITAYFTEEAIITIICRKVKIYLTSKIEVI